jgi:hypothetical protein
VNTTLRNRLRNRKRRIQRRLRPNTWTEQPIPMFRARNLHYELAGKVHGLACGGIGATHLLAQRLGLPRAIDEELHLLERHRRETSREWELGSDAKALGCADRPGDPYPQRPHASCSQRHLHWQSGFDSAQKLTLPAETLARHVGQGFRTVPADVGKDIPLDLRASECRQ